MELNLVLPYKRLPKDEKGDETKAADLTRIILTRCVDTKFQQKIPSSESRMWGRILDEFDEKKDTIEINEDQFDFLKKTVNETDLPPGLSSWLNLVRDHFDEMKKEMKEHKERDKEKVGKKIGAVG